MPATPKKTSEIANTYSAAATDRVVLLSNAAGNSATATIELRYLIGNSAAVRVINAPANSTSTNVVAGAVMTDGTYLYVATSNNVVKRITLDTF